MIIFIRCILIFGAFRQYHGLIKVEEYIENNDNSKIMGPTRRIDHSSVIIGVPSEVSHLPKAEPIMPGHTLLRPALGMLKSAVKFPHRELDYGAGVYGNPNNLGIKYAGRNERVLYTKFRRYLPLEILMLRTADKLNRINRKNKLYGRRHVKRKRLGRDGDTPNNTVLDQKQTLNAQVGNAILDHESGHISSHEGGHDSAHDKSHELQKQTLNAEVENTKLDHESGHISSHEGGHDSAHDKSHELQKQTLNAEVENAKLDHESGHISSHEGGHDSAHDKSHELQKQTLNAEVENATLDHESGHISSHEGGHDSAHDKSHELQKQTLNANNAPLSHESGHISSHEGGHDSRHDNSHEIVHESGHISSHEGGHDSAHDKSHESDKKAFKAKAKNTPLSHESGHISSHEGGHDSSHSDSHEIIHESGHISSHEDGHDSAHDDSHALDLGNQPKNKNLKLKKNKLKGSYKSVKKGRPYHQIFQKHSAQQNFMDHYMNKNGRRFMNTIISQLRALRRKIPHSPKIVKMRQTLEDGNAEREAAKPEDKNKKDLKKEKLKEKEVLVKDLTESAEHAPDYSEISSESTGSSSVSTEEDSESQEEEVQKIGYNNQIWSWNNNTQFNHIKISQAAPEYKDLVPSTPQNAEDIRTWWFFHDSDLLSELQESPGDDKPSTEESE